jgi:endo-1,4-beta-xylanase
MRLRPIGSHYLSRREAAASLAAAILSTPLACATANLGLSEAAARVGMRFGGIIGGSPIGQPIADFDDPAYRALLVRECSLLVPENELKMTTTWPERDRFNLEPAERILAFAEAHKLAVRGHNLVWHDRYTPKWLLDYDFGKQPQVEAERLLRAYITAVASRFGERIISWDVINEAVDPVTGELRSTIFTRILGPRAIGIALATAREAFPRTQLVYNDFMGWAKEGGPHRAGVLALLRGLREKKVPIDALGIQSHLGTGADLDDIDATAWGHFLTDATNLGLALVITEFDVNDGGLTGSVDQRDTIVAKVAQHYLDQLFDYRQLRDVVAWGLVDKYSWISAYMPRGDGLETRPTLFDSQFRPKPLYRALERAFAHAPSRSATR